MLNLQLNASPLRKCMALLAVVVIAAFGFIQAVHMHGGPAEQAGHSSLHCSLCAAAHSIAVVTHAGTTVAPMMQAAIVPALDPQLQSHLHIPSSFIRPPPQGL